ncbi:hypothetical protein EMN47_13965 [Prolixibacteraceae bacterium JC049]|nr:hypothetical protein [Prolixibacteraceae bacterium JC049]
MYNLLLAEFIEACIIHHERRQNHEIEGKPDSEEKGDGIRMLRGKSEEHGYRHRIRNVKMFNGSIQSNFCLISFVEKKKAIFAITYSYD